MLPHSLRFLLSRPAVGALLSCLLAVSLLAGVTVTQNAGAGATSWPGAPLLCTVVNPQSELTIGEGFGATSTDSYAQSFTLTGSDDYTLQSVCLYVGGGAGTTGTTTLTLNLYNIVGGVAPNPNAYTAGVNLLGGGSGLPISYTPQPNGLLRLDFSEGDQVRLRAGYLYVLEIAGVGGTNPLNWYRTGADTYAGGAAYRSRSWINGMSTRDFGLAVYGVINHDPLPPSQCTVDAGVMHQQIDGFGAGVAFLYDGQDPLNDAQMDQIYGTSGTQFGLTLIRLRIPPDGNYTAAVADGQKAHARGARILASPWTPPAAMKTSNNLVGGALLPAQYAAYATYLDDFAKHMAANGAPLTVISVQNEPDWDPDYEGCTWTAEQLHTFCRDHAGAISVPVMMPESLNFNQALSDPTLNDPVAAANVDYIGGHLYGAEIYGATIRDYPLARSLGKPIWMTEFLVNDQGPTYGLPGQPLGYALTTAQQIVDCLTVGNMSAYIWWKCIGTANGLLDNESVPQRRGYVMAQFSRFARPGSRRIEVADNTSPLSLVAFKDSTLQQVAIVAVNNSTVAVAQQFHLKGWATSAVTPWVTSATQSLEAQTPLLVTEGAFTYTLPAMTMVTFVGTIAGVTPPAAPTFATPSASTANASQTLTGTAGVGQTVTVYEGSTVLGTATAGSDGHWSLVVALPLGVHRLTATCTDAAGLVSGISSTFTLTVGQCRFLALSARAPVGAGDQTLILGFVFAGGGKPTLIRGVGPGLVKGDASLAGQELADPLLTLNELQTVDNTSRFVAIATNDNWGGTEELRTKMSALGMGALDDTSADAALLTTPTRAVYTAQISGVGNTTGVALAETYDANFTDKTKRLAALSVRNQVGTGAAQLIVGFVLVGDAPKRMILRGVGPGLVPTVAASAVLANPTLQLNKLNTTTMTWAVVGANDDWGGAADLATAMSKAGMGALAADSKDAVLLIDLQPGIYTAQLSGVGETTGIGLVEIYEAP